MRNPLHTMDTGLRCQSLIILIFSCAFFDVAVCQVYSWSVAVPLSITVCNGSSTLYLNWTFSPPTPDPLVIEWTKQGTSGAFDNAATFASGNFTPNAAYAGRVSRTGSTAEIAIQGPLTAADGGVYRVTVTDGGGLPITADANVIVPAVIVPLSASCQGTDAGGYTVSCSAEVSPPVTLQLKNSTDIIIDSGSSVNELRKTVSNAANLTFQCSVTGDGSECVTPNTADVTCKPDNSPTTTEGTTRPTPKPGICDNNHLCYLFLLLLLLLLIPICVLVWWCRKKKRDKKSEQSNDKNMKELNTHQKDARL